MKKAVLVVALLAVLVGTASAFELSPTVAPLQSAGPAAIAGTETGFSLSGAGIISEPGPTCRWIFIGGKWVLYCT